MVGARYAVPVFAEADPLICPESSRNVFAEAPVRGCPECKQSRRAVVKRSATRPEHKRFRRGRFSTCPAYHAPSLVILNAVKDLSYACNLQLHSIPPAIIFYHLFMEH